MKIYPYIKTNVPITLPVSLADMKTYLKIDTDVDDSLITDLINTVALFIENYTRRELIEKTFKTLRDGFYDDSRLDRLFPYQSTSFLILKSPFVSVESIKYFKNDVLETVDSSIYYSTVENFYSSIVLKADKSWPSNIDDRLQAVEINFKAGYGTQASDIPIDLRNAIKMIVAFLYFNRGDCTFATISEQLRATGALSSAKTILDLYKIRDISVP